MRIPTINDNQVQLNPLPTVRRQALQSTAGESYGQALGQVGNVVSAIQAEERKKADTAAVLEADTALSQWSTNAMYDPEKGALAQQGKNAFDLPNKVLPEFDKQYSQLETGLKSSRAKLIFKQAAAQQRDRLNTQLNQHEFSQRDAYYDQVDNDSLLQSINAASLSAGDPAGIDAELSRQSAIINTRASRKGWDEVQRNSAIVKARAATHEAVIKRLITAGDTKAADNYLNAHIVDLTADDSESLQRMLLSGENSLSAAQARAQKEVADSLSKEGDSLLARGGLSSAWIEANRRQLDPADFRYFYNQLNGGGSGPRNSMLYADLRERAGKGEDVRNDARDALRSGSIQATDYDRLIGEVETNRPSWYKRGSQYISQMSGVSDLNPDPTGAQTKATMLDQWGDWAREHPNAKDGEAQAAYQDIVSHNMLVQIAGLPLPKFLVGSRLSPDIAKTEIETVNAYRSGKLDKQEFERQAAVIQQWRNAMQHKKGAK